MILDFGNVVLFQHRHFDEAWESRSVLADDLARFWESRSVPTDDLTSCVTGKSLLYSNGYLQEQGNRWHPSEGFNGGQHG